MPDQKNNRVFTLMSNNMNIKYIAAGMAAFGAVVLSSCSDFTEIDAKGKNLLNRTQDLELLLNADYSLSATVMQEIAVI